MRIWEESDRTSDDLDNIFRRIMEGNMNMCANLDLNLS